MMEMFCAKGQNNRQLGLGLVCRKVSHVSRVQVKRILVQQGMDREQGDSHLGGPDQTLHSYIPRTTLTVLAHPSSMISLGSAT